MPQQLKKLFVLLLLALIPGYFLVRAELLGFEVGPVDAQETGDALFLDNVVREFLPFSRELEQLALDLRMLGGQREQNGIFISEKGLMRNIDQANETFIDQNIAEVAIFGQRLTASSGGKKTTYLAILPTASGILQQDLPRFAQSALMVDQQRQTEMIYNRLSTVVRTIDVYSALYNRRDQYIFYRTDSGLTSLGGYYAYASIAARMEIANRSLNQFNIEYIDYDYYGNLYQMPAGTVGGWEGNTAPYRLVKPDTLSLFRYGGNREYTVSKRGGEGGERTYHTLFPTHQLELGNPLGIYLGGSSAITEIQSSAPYSRNLLVFGDDTAVAWLPFLANHYRRITFVNFRNMRSADFAEIHPEQYEQVLFAYGIETFIQYNHPSMARYIVWSDDSATGNRLSSGSVPAP